MDQTILGTGCETGIPLKSLGCRKASIIRILKGIEFERFRKEAGLNSFNLTPKKWINATNAIGIHSKSGRHGGTYAHKDLAFEFGS